MPSTTSDGNGLEQSSALAVALDWQPGKTNQYHPEFDNTHVPSYSLKTVFLH